MNVFSAFNGIGCGFVALERAGIKVDKYYSAEIDQRAIKVNDKNWPRTIQFGDITKIRGEHFLSPIDLLMGGSPCQGFSFAGKRLNFDDPRSKLFFEFVRIKDELSPKYFFLENVRMSAESENVITEILGAEPVFVNSMLVSAQSRPRLYWTNIPGPFEFSDKGLTAYDIITSTTNRKTKSYSSHLSYKTFNTGRCVKVGHDYSTKFEQGQRVYSLYSKVPTLDTKCGGNRDAKIAISESEYISLNPIEHERLQGLPDNYTRGISTSARNKALGNGWQVDTIVEFFKHLPDEYKITPLS